MLTRTQDFDLSFMRAWLYSSDVMESQRDDSPTLHGTCVTDKAVGIENGVAKSALFRPVKIKPNFASLFEAFSLILDDTAKRDRHSIIISSYQTKENYPEDYWRNPPPEWREFRELLQWLIDGFGTVIVLPAGNHRPRSVYIDTFPAQFAEDPELPIVVVGSTNDRGYKSHFNQELRHGEMAWAMGEKLVCAGRSKGTATKTVSGTSFSAGMVCASI